jgi:hypothetical protein
LKDTSFVYVKFASPTKSQPYINLNKNFATIAEGICLLSDLNLCKVSKNGSPDLPECSIGNEAN